MKITDARKGEVFKSLATMSYIEVGRHFDFDKHYKNDASVRNAVYRTYQEVLSDPKKFGVNDEVIDLVKQSLKTRSIKRTKTASPVEEDIKMSPIDRNDLKGMVMTGRNKAAGLLDKKMDMLAKSPKKLDKENIVSLAKVFGIYFDKAQIVQGEATENIAVLAKNVDENMSPDDAMSELLKMREKTQEDKYSKDNK